MATPATLTLTVVGVGDYDGRGRAQLAGASGHVFVDLTKDQARALAPHLYQKIALTLRLDRDDEGGADR